MSLSLATHWQRVYLYCFLPSLGCASQPCSYAPFTDALLGPLRILLLESSELLLFSARKLTRCTKKTALCSSPAAGKILVSFCFPFLGKNKLGWRNENCKRGWWVSSTHLMSVWKWKYRARGHHQSNARFARKGLWRRPDPTTCSIYSVLE